MSKGWILLVVLLYAQFSVAQTKQTTTYQQVWLGYVNHIRLSSKWGIGIDAHIRTKDDFFNGFYQSAIRAGLTYYVTDLLRITAGYAYFNHYPDEGHKNIAQPEHRLFQQLQWQNGYGKVTAFQRLRLEERYRHNILNDSTLANGFAFNYRIRYNYQIQVPLKKIFFDKLSVVAADEIMINFGKQIVNNYFDQNRIFAGFAYQTRGTDQLQIGYMNLFQQLSAGNKYRRIHAVRIFYLHNLELRRKEAKQ